MNARFIAITILCVTCLLVGCQPPASGPEARNTSVIPPADDVSLFSLVAERVDGSGDFKLSSLSGQPLLVYYFAPWSFSGRDDLPRMEALLASGISLLPVLVDRQAGDIASVALPSTDATLPVVKSGEDLLRLAGGIRALPSVVLFDSEGKAVNVWPGHPATSNTLAEIALALK